MTLMRHFELAQANGNEERDEDDIQFNVERFIDELVAFMRKHGAMVAEQDEVKVRANFNPFLTVFFF